jgi:hypothetical protein
MNEWTSYKGDALTPPEQIKGFNKLSEEHKKLFRAFLKNWYKALGEPEDHQPVKVTFLKTYLRVDFKGEWYHVTGTNTWY